MDYQILIFFILAILTIALVALIVYVIMVLKDLRETIQKTNKILDGAKGITSLISNPLQGVSGVVSGVLSVIKEFRKGL